jgi:hypothetical protein
VHVRTLGDLCLFGLDQLQLWTSADKSLGRHHGFLGSVRMPRFRTYLESLPSDIVVIDKPTGGDMAHMVPDLSRVGTNCLADARKDSKLDYGRGGSGLEPGFTLATPFNLVDVLDSRNPNFADHMERLGYSSEVIDTCFDRAAVIADDFHAEQAVLRQAGKL